MKYYPPKNETDIDAPYVDWNPTVTPPVGSVLPKEAIEHPMREIVTVIENAGLIPDETNLTQLLQAIEIIIERHIAEYIQKV